MNKRDCIIVTGGTGFIGRHLVSALRKRHEKELEIIALGSKDVDLANQDQTFRWFEAQRARGTCLHLFHLAAFYKAGGWPVKHPATQFHINFSINVNLLEAWKRFFPEAKLTSVLSYCVYPPHDKPHPESELWGTEPEDYLFAYALTKKAMLIGQRAYAKEFGLKSTSVILPTIYGPGDNFTENSHVMGALIGKFARASRQNGASVEVWGDGKQRREFLYVEDAVEAILLASERSQAEAFNMGTDEAPSIRDVIVEIQKATGFQGAIDYKTDRFVGVNTRVLDSSAARSTLGWKPSTSLAEGIRKTVKAYEQELLQGAPQTAASTSS